jgi:uncharacterized protein (DUF433 family)
MQLEDYFDFLAPDDIRLKGTRIGIETVLYEYLHGSQSPEVIAQRYSVSLEQVHATITYYLHNEETLRAYLTAWLEHGRQMRQQQDRSPSDAVTRLRAVKRQGQPAKTAAGE